MTVKNIQTVICRSQDFSIIHFSFLNRNLRGMSVLEARKYLDAIIALKVPANRTPIGRLVSGDHRHPRFPQKAARVLKRAIHSLVSRIQAEDSTIREDRLMISVLTADRNAIRYRPYLRAMGSMDYTRRMTYDLSLSLLILPQIK